MNEATKERGSVNWFDASKGYGFLQRRDGSDVFVHFSAIEMDGYKTLQDGDEVEFTVESSPKGLQAANVSVIGY